MSGKFTITNFNGGGNNMRDLSGSVGGRFDISGSRNSGYVGVERHGQLFSSRNSNTIVSGGFSRDIGSNTSINTGISHGSKSGTTGTIGISKRF
jgi:hypothetical protein